MAIGSPAIAHDLCSRSSTPQTLVNPLRGELAQVIDPPRPIALTGGAACWESAKTGIDRSPPMRGFRDLENIAREVELCRI
ncbi:hypothetical protein H6F46_00550 [Limnothrix sp. FACHB-1083]|nr:hypothetical protein [Limnothrix sp. FACHB-1088]MBD2159175.1 hypothetical protein [Limnothrix sp. FACHB-1083]